MCSTRPNPARITMNAVVKWGKLYGAAAALAIAEAARSAPGPLIVIAQNSREAESLSDEIRFFAGPSSTASGCSPIWRRCPTTASPPIPISPPPGSPHWRNCRARATACGWLPSIRCCSDWRRAATSRPTRSKCMSTRRSIWRRCARNWRWPDMPPSLKSWRTANSRCAAR